MKEKRLKKIELEVGVVSAIALLLLSAAIVMVGNLPMLSRSYVIIVNFEYANYLRKGAPVKIAGGVPAGKVKDIHLSPQGGVDVELMIKNSIRINKDATFHLYSSSMVGTRYIEILDYSGKPPYIKPGERVQGVSVMGFNRLFEVLGEAASIVTKSLSSPESQQSISSSINSFIKAVRDLVATINSVQNNLGKTMKSFSHSAAKVSRLLDKTEKALTELEAAARNTRKMTDDLSKADFRRIANTINELQEAITNLKVISSEISSPETRQRINNIIANLESFSEEVKENPSALFFGKER